MSKFSIRGEEWDLTGSEEANHPILRWLNALTVGLLALEDPRVDAVLKAGNIVIENRDGERLFPAAPPAIERSH